MLQSTATYKDPEKPVEQALIHRIRITLTSRNVRSLEKGESGTGFQCSVFITFAFITLANNILVAPFSIFFFSISNFIHFNLFVMLASCLPFYSLLVY